MFTLKGGVIIKSVIGVCVLVGLLILFSGCGSLTNPVTNNLVLSIVDAPDLQYQDVHISIAKVFIKPMGGGEWIQAGDYSGEPYEINLLDYRIKELVLPEMGVPVGGYEEIRIVLNNTGYIILSSEPTVRYPLTVGEPLEADETEDEDDDEDILGDDEQAIDIEYPFYITDTGMTAIQVDFNVAEMIEPNEDTVETDFILKPEEVKAVDKDDVCEIEGKVTTVNGPLTGQSVYVSLYKVGGELVASTWAIQEEIEDEDEEDKVAEPGKFKIRGVLPGDYYLTVEATGFNTVTVSGITVGEDSEDIEIGEDEDDDEEINYIVEGAEIVDEAIVLTPLQ